MKKQVNLDCSLPQFLVLSSHVARGLTHLDTSCLNGMVYGNI